MAHALACMDTCTASASGRSLLNRLQSLIDPMQDITSMQDPTLRVHTTQALGIDDLFF